MWAHVMGRPEYEVMEGFVKIVFRRVKQDKGVNGGLNGGLNENQIKTLEYIRMHEGCQVKDISAELNVPIDTIDKHISVLLKKSLIERRGSKKTGGYYAR